MEKQSLRKVYDDLRQKFPNKIPTLSALREEVVLKNNQSTYTFTFDERVAGTDAEKKLSIKDAFRVVGLGMYLLVENRTKPGTGVLMSYPNPVAIGTACASANDVLPSDLETIFNGQATARVDQTLIFDAIDMRRFRKVPQTQLSAINDNDQAEYLDGLFEIVPELTLLGDKKNEIKVTIPSFSGIKIQATASNFDVKLVCYATGFTIPGGSALRQ